MFKFCIERANVIYISKFHTIRHSKLYMHQFNSNQNKLNRISGNLNTMNSFVTGLRKGHQKAISKRKGDHIPSGPNSFNFSCFF